MRERDDEKMAINAYGAFLHEQFAGQIDWSRGNDPPDYLLHVDGTSFAVEVTTITPQYDREARDLLPDIGLSAMMHRFTAEVEREANATNPLDALYLFHLDGPHGRFESSRKNLGKAILQFVESNRNSGDVAMHEIGSVDDYTLWMGKLKNESPGISWGYAAQTSGPIANSVAEFDTLVQNAVADKRKKLARIDSRKVLLLIDQYYFLPSVYFNQCPICSQPDPTFDAVCVVTSDSAVHPLWHW